MIIPFPEMGNGNVISYQLNSYFVSDGT